MSAPASARAVILDRDGTIVVDRGYLSDPQQLQLLPGAAEGLATLHRAGHPLIVISNQSGVGRGYFTLARLQEVNEGLAAMLAQAGAPLAGLYFCPHRPQDACDCRKPNTALLLRAAAQLGFTPAQAVVIGDKSSDVELGRRVNATTILVSADGSATDAVTTAADYTARDLIEAAGVIRQLDARPASAASRQGA